MFEVCWCSFGRLSGSGGSELLTSTSELTGTSRTTTTSRNALVTSTERRTVDQRELLPSRSTAILGPFKFDWGEIRVKFVEGRRAAQKRVTGGRWRRIVLGVLLAVQVVRLRGRPRLWPYR